MLKNKKAQEVPFIIKLILTITIILFVLWLIWKISPNLGDKIFGWI